MQTTFPAIPTATVLDGLEPFNVGNVSLTYRGQILLADRSIRGAVVKDLPALELANELIAYNFARHCYCRVPSSFLGVVESSYISTNNGPTIPDGRRLVFVSEDVKAPNILQYIERNDDVIFLERFMSALSGADDVGDLYAFDEYVANIDRHPGNLLYGGADRFWWIDHGHCFSGPKWTPSKLDPHLKYRNRLSDWLTPCMDAGKRSKHRKSIAKFRNKVQMLDVNRIVRDSFAYQLLPVPIADTLVNFLRVRVDQIERFASEALGVPWLV